jgi:hypothetical protein
MKILYVILLIIYNIAYAESGSMELDQELLRGFAEDNIDNQEEMNIEENDDVILNDNYFRKFAIIRAINKITAQSSLEKIAVGDSAKYGNLTISIKSCWAADPEISPENKILLQVEEKSYSNTSNIHIFYGWLFSNTPSISSIEHPVYDIIAVKCIDK